jgi:hypothetical protein
MEAGSQTSDECSSSPGTKQHTNLAPTEHAGAMTGTDISHRYWNEMNVEEFLSDKEPPSFPLQEQIDFQIFKTLPEPKIQAQVIAFINKQHRTATGNITMINEELLKRFYSGECYLGVLWERRPTQELGIAPANPTAVGLEHGLIIGTMLGVVFSARILNETAVPKQMSAMKSAYISYLCVEESHRKQALCMGLIRPMLSYGHQCGIKHAYNLVSQPHHSASSAVQSWFRIIDLARAKKAGFAVKEAKQNKDRSDVRSRLIYQLPKRKGEAVKVAPGVFFREYSKLNQDNIFGLNSEQSLTMFDLYSCPAGVFALIPLPIHIQRTDVTIVLAQLAICLPRSDVKELLVEVFHTAKEADYPIVYGYVTGQVTETLIGSLRGDLTNAANFLEFYNNGTAIMPRNFYMPLI